MKGLGAGSMAMAAAAATAGEGAPPQPAGAARPVHRVVTGVESDGRSRFILDGPPPNAGLRVAGNVVVTDIWQTASTPADNAGSSDTVGGPLRLSPPSGGSVFRIIDFPPEAEHRAGLARELKAGDDGSGIVDAMRKGGTDRPGFHTTNTIDYVVVVSGEIFALADDAETRLVAGDVFVQRGTSHAWVNRSQSTARLAFVLIDAKPLS